jgi:integrase
MATIRKRGSSWQVQVRRQGFPPLVRTFASHADATTWARDKERAIDRAELSPNHRDLKTITVHDLLLRYEREVTVQKRGADREQFKLRVLRSHSLSKASLDKVTGAMIAAYRDDRLRIVTSGTVRRELAILQHCFEVARREWDIAIATNPVRQIALPSPSKARQRRLEPDDTDRFWQAADRARAAWVKPFLILSIETGMRRGELLSIQWQDVNSSASLIRISKTKNGYERVIPLTPLAARTILSLPRSSDRVFPLAPGAVRQAWDRLIKRAGIKDLRLHDLRHEAVSRFFEYGLTVPEVALISGHKDPRMLSRYTYLRPEKVAEKLAKATVD